MKEKQLIIPHGFLNTDQDLGIGYRDGEYPRSLNLVTDHGGGVKRNLKSFVNIGFVPPSGLSKAIGSVTDSSGNSIFWFIWNSNNDHMIVRHYVTDDSYDIIWRGAALKFASDRRIHGTFVHNRYLIFTDGKKSGDNDIVGNDIRCIDIEKATLKGKTLTYFIHWSDNVFSSGTQYTIEIVDLAGNPVLPPTVFYTAGGLGFDVELSIFLFNLNTQPVVARYVGSKIEVTAGAPENIVKITSSKGDLVLISDNHYAPFDGGDPFYESEALNLARANAIGEIRPIYSNDPSLEVNMFAGKIFKFRYRYVYYDGGRSKWSSESYIPTNLIRPINESDRNDYGYNLFKLIFEDPVLESPYWRCIVRSVEIAYIDSWAGPWRRHGVYDVAELGIKSIFQLFLRKHISDLGDGGVVESDDSGSPDAQTLGLFSWVPSVVLALDSVVTKDGDTSVVVGGNKFMGDWPGVGVKITYNNPFVLSPPTGLVDQEQTSVKLKAGGIYSLGIALEDKVGRLTPVRKIGAIKIPLDEFRTGIAYTPEVELYGTPPPWAVAYRLYLTENENQEIYFQTEVDRVVYWKVEDGVWQSTTYSAGDATYVGFELASDFMDEDISQEYIEKSRMFIPEDGDWIVIFDGADVYEFPIAGHILGYPTASSVSRFIVYIKFEPSQPNFSNKGKTGVVAEVYRPRRIRTGLYYELPDRYLIQYSGETPNYGGTVLIVWGDTWVIRHKKVDSSGTRLLEYESPSMILNLSPDRRVRPFGRPNAVGEHEPIRFNEVRVSDYASPSRNNLNNFRSAEVIYTESFLGAIMRILNVNTVLFIVMESGSRSIYYNKDRLLTLTGEILTAADGLQHGPSWFKYGSIHPHSIVLSHNYVYGFDIKKGIVWRFSVGAGVDPINNGVMELFKGFDDFSVDIIGGYDEYYDMYMITFPNVTYGFREYILRWDGEFSFVPDYYGRSGKSLYSSKGGKIYKHHAGSTWNNFYGINYVSEIDLVVNDRYPLTKVFWAITVDGSKFTVPKMVTSLGHETSMNASKWKRYYDKWHANVLRDGTDPRFNSYPIAERYARAINAGRHMMGEYAVVTLRADDSSSDVELRSVAVEYSLKSS